MQFQAYPSWRYHAELEPRVVATPEEDQALGEGWADTPAAFEQEVIPPAVSEQEVEPCSSSKRRKKK